MGGLILLDGGHANFAKYQLDEDEKELYDLIARGESVTSGYNAKARNTLNRLCRNGMIKNHGTRSRPVWRICEDWKQRNYMVVDLEDESFWNWV